MTTLETLLAPSRREVLRQAIGKRFSCGSFTGTPTAAQWSVLGFLAERCAMPGCRILLMHVQESVFTGTLLGSGRITGCTSAALIIADPHVQNSRIFAGISGEYFVLEAANEGIASCFLTSGFREKLLPIPSGMNGEALALIALGSTDQIASGERKRKSLEKLCAGSIDLWPKEALAAAEAIRMAPSQNNAQPWTIRLKADTLSVEASPRNAFEVGIAALHAEIALETPHIWSYSSWLGGITASAVLTAP